MPLSPFDPWGVVAVLVGAGIGLGLRRLMTRIRYFIDDPYARVMWSGVTLRKVALSDIEAIDTKVALWNELWCNAFFAWRRSVRIRRKSGLARNFIITPANRDEFIRQLRERLDGRVDQRGQLQTHPRLNQPNG